MKCISLCFHAKSVGTMKVKPYGFMYYSKTLKFDTQINTEDQRLEKKLKFSIHVVSVKIRDTFHSITLYFKDFSRARTT